MAGRAVARIVGLLALGVGLGVPVATANLSSSTSSFYEPTTIRSYVADLDVDAMARGYQRPALTGRTDGAGE